MSILYWGRRFEAFAERLKSHSADGDAYGGIHSEASVKGLRAALATQRAELRPVVLAPPTADDLTALLALAPLVIGIPVIVLLPSSDNETLALAHRLRPRFVSSGDGAWDDAATVAGNILKKRKEP